MDFSRISAPTRAAARLLELGLLLVIPLVFYRVFAEQFTFAKLALTELLVLAGAALLVAGLALGWVQWPRSLPLGAPLGLLSAAVVCSCLMSPVPGFSFAEASPFLCGPLWFLIVTATGKGEVRLRGLAALVTMAGGVAALIAVVQWSGHDPLQFGGYHVEWGTLRRSMRLYSTFGNPNFVAGYLIGAIFLALGLTATARTRAILILGSAAVLVMFAAIIGTRSRGAWVGLAAGLLVARTVWKQKVSATRPAGDGNTAIQLGGWILPGGLLALLPDLTQQLHALAVHLEGRYFLARASWPMFAEHPLFGGGWGTFQLRFLDLQARFLEAHPEDLRHWTHMRQLHNDPMQILLEAGTLGLVAFGWLLWTYGREVRSVAKCAPSARWWLGASGGGVTAILANSLFNFQFAVPPTLILLFTLMALPDLLRPPGPEPSEPGRADTSGGKRRWGCALAGGAGVALTGLLMFQVAHRVQAELALGRGLERERQGDASLAARYFRTGIDRMTDEGRLHYGLARALYMQNQNAGALAEVLKAERTFADSHLAVLKARIVEQLGFRGPALELYRHALWLDPTLKSVPEDIERLSR